MRAGTVPTAIAAVLGGAGGDRARRCVSLSRLLAKVGAHIIGLFGWGWGAHCGSDPASLYTVANSQVIASIRFRLSVYHVN